MKICTEYKEIDDLEATRLLETGTFNLQRKFNPRWAATLAEAIRTNCFDQTTTIKIARFDGRDYLVDGQHRLSAVRDTGVPTGFSVIRVSCDSMDDLVKIYERTDIGKRRTMADFLKIERLDEELGLTPTQTRLSAQPMRLLKHGFTHPPFNEMSVDDTMRLLRDFAPEIKTYWQLVTLPSKTMANAIKRRQFIAVALVTLRYQFGRASAFWEEVAQNNALPKHDGRHALVELCVSVKDVNHEDQSIHCRKIASCWNYYFENKEMTRNPMVRDPEKPITILGTPYTDRDFIRR